jgi:cholesterol oxidase
MGMVEDFIDSSIAVGCGACLGGGSLFMVAYYYN